MHGDVETFVALRDKVEAWEAEDVLDLTSKEKAIMRHLAVSPDYSRMQSVPHLYRNKKLRILVALGDFLAELPKTALGEEVDRINSRRPPGMKKATLGWGGGA